MNIIKTKKRINQIKQGALGILCAHKSLEVDIKLNLSDKKLEELIKLLGDKADKFLDIKRSTHRVIFCREDVNGLPPGQLACYDSDGTDDFRVMDEKALSKKDQARFASLKKDLDAME